MTSSRAVNGKPVPEPPGAEEPATRLIRRRPLHDEAAERLRDMIVEGHLAAGERVNEADLCAQLGISRTPLREALKVLAAEGLGASRLQTLVRVTLPLLRPSLVSAGLLAFISSFDELVVALFLAGPNMTLPKKMFDNIMMEIDPTIAAVSVMQILLVSIVLVLIGRFGRGLQGSAR